MAAVAAPAARSFFSCTSFSDSIYWSGATPMAFQESVNAAMEAMGRPLQRGPTAVPHSTIRDAVMSYGWKYRKYPFSFEESVKFIPVVLNALEANGAFLRWTGGDGTLNTMVFEYGGTLVPNTSLPVVGVALFRDTIIVAHNGDSEALGKASESLAAALSQGIEQQGFPVQKHAALVGDRIRWFIKLRGYPFGFPPCASVIAGVANTMSVLGYEAMAFHDQVFLFHRKGEGEKATSSPPTMHLGVILYADRFIVSGRRAADFVERFQAHCGMYGYGECFVIQKTSVMYGPKHHWAASNDIEIKIVGYPFLFGNPVRSEVGTAVPFVLEFLTRTVSTKVLMTRVALGSTAIVIPFDGLFEQGPLVGRGMVRALLAHRDTAYISGSASAPLLGLLESAATNIGAVVQNPWTSDRSRMGRRRRPVTRQFRLKLRGYPFSYVLKEAGGVLAAMAMAVSVQGGIELMPSGSSMYWRVGKDSHDTCALMFFRETDPALSVAHISSFAHIPNTLEPLLWAAPDVVAPEVEAGGDEFSDDDLPPPNYDDVVFDAEK